MQDSFSELLHSDAANQCISYCGTTRSKAGDGMLSLPTLLRCPIKEKCKKKLTRTFKFLLPIFDRNKQRINMWPQGPKDFIGNQNAVRYRKTRKYLKVNTEKQNTEMKNLNVEID